MINKIILLALFASICFCLDDIFTLDGSGLTYCVDGHSCKKAVGSSCLSDSDCIPNSVCTSNDSISESSKYCDCQEGFSPSQDALSCLLDREGEPNNGTANGHRCTVYNIPCSYANSMCLSKEGNLSDLLCQCDLGATEESLDVCKKQVGTICEVDSECVAQASCKLKEAYKFCDDSGSETLIVSIALTGILQLIFRMSSF